MSDPAFLIELSKKKRSMTCIRSNMNSTLEKSDQPKSDRIKLITPFEVKLSINHRVISIEDTWQGLM